MKRDEKTEKKLKDLLKNSPAQKGEIFCYDSLSSTNDAAKELAGFSCPEWSLVLSKTQSAGKGRMGRRFFSPKGKGLYMSFVLYPKEKCQNPGLLTACGAVAVYRAIFNLAGILTQIKWVNDIYYQEKKLCGILAEGQIGAKGLLESVILGIGVNLTRPQEGYDPEIDHKTIALDEMVEQIPGKEALCVEILKEFAAIYQALPDTYFLEDYKKASCVLGRRISYWQNGTIREGTAQDIDSEARLVIENEGGQTETLGAGEINLLRPLN